jgi:hypothetical protein
MYAKFFVFLHVCFRCHDFSLVNLKLAS